MSQDNPTPQSTEAEQSVLGALLIDNDAVDRMGDLRAEHFYRGEHRAIFTEILAQITAGKTCDVISVFDALQGKIEDCLVYLNQLHQNTPSSANIARYAGIVRDKAIKRGLIVLARKAEESVLSSPESAGVLVDRVSSALEALAQERVRQEPTKARDDMAAHMEELESRLEGGTKGISTGYPDLDEKVMLRKGELIVLAARPKMGKTSMALNLALNVATDHSVLFLSMEMPKSQLHDRNLAVLGNIPLAHIITPKLMTDGDWTGLTSALQKIDNMNLFLDDQGGLRLLDVRMKAKNLKRKHGLDLLVVDYLQLMEGDGDNRNSQIEGITRGLKSLAKELGICIILLSQLNRDLEKRPNKRPQPSDLRDSGAIEQDADAVIFLYRDEVYNPDSPDKGICEVNVALCRQGAPGCVALTYIGEKTRFESLVRGWTPHIVQTSSKRKGLADHL